MTISLTPFRPAQLRAQLRVDKLRTCCSTSSMKRVLIACLLYGSVWSGVAQTNVNRQLLVEQQNYVAWMARMLSPDCWYSLDGKLYAKTTDLSARKAALAFKEACSKYTVFTNKTDRRELINSILMQQQGVEKLLSPKGSTNLFSMQRERTLLSLPRFKLVQSLINGDAIVQDTEEDPNTYYVYEFGRAVDDKYYRDGLLLYEGLKTYETVGGVTKTVKAYTSVRLSEEDRELLSRVQDAFKAKSRELTQTISVLNKARK